MQCLDILNNLYIIYFYSFVSMYEMYFNLQFGKFNTIFKLHEWQKSENGHLNNVFIEGSNIYKVF